MKGILANDFELLLKKNAVILEDLSNEISNVKTSLSDLSGEFKSSELNFISNKINLGLLQLDNVFKKTAAYQSVLSGVYEGYKNQTFQIVSDINNLMS